MTATAVGPGVDYDIVSAVASGVHVQFLDAESITFIVYANAGDQGVTLKESISGASEQNLAVIDTLYKKAGAGGAWTEITQAAAATYTLSDATNDMLMFTVKASSLSDGFNAVECTTTGTSPVTWAIRNGLKVKRALPNLNDAV